MKNMKNIPLATVLQRFSTIDVVKLSCLVQFNHVSSGVHFSGAAPIFFRAKSIQPPLKMARMPMMLQLENGSKFLIKN